MEKSVDPGALSKPAEWPTAALGRQAGGAGREQLVPSLGGHLENWPGSGGTWGVGGVEVAGNGDLGLEGESHSDFVNSSSPVLLFFRPAGPLAHLAPSLLLPPFSGGLGYVSDSSLGPNIPNPNPQGSEAPGVGPGQTYVKIAPQAICWFACSGIQENADFLIERPGVGPETAFLIGF